MTLEYPASRGHKPAEKVSHVAKASVLSKTASDPNMKDREVLLVYFLKREYEGAIDTVFSAQIPSSYTYLRIVVASEPPTLKGLR